MLIHLDKVSLELGKKPILKAANLVLEPKERVCLVGRNGAGKSTLMKLLTRELTPDEGEVRYREHLTLTKLQQELPDRLERTVWEVIQEGLKSIQDTISEYEALSQQPQTSERLARMEHLQKLIDLHGGWQLNQRVDSIITQLNLPKETRLSALSGGWQRRVLLGQALVSQPDVLMLDEPTNHLDIATIQWLEQVIRSYPGTVIFVTHDRYFLEKLATRIVEIDRGTLSNFPGSYSRYLTLKQQQLEAEKTHNALFDKKLAEEEVWIRQGVKARGTRNMGRVRSLEQMRETAAARVKPQGIAKFVIQNGERSARKIIEARSISHTFTGDEKPLIKDFYFKIMRGDRIGLIGNNGLGKSTLLRILLGELTPDTGSVKIGENLTIGYFDQNRIDLQEEKSIAFNVGGGKDYIQVYGKDRHVVGYLKSFLFTPERAMTPVQVLSGGERNRVLLAKLFATPWNVLILDEPTNDLDVQMLEVLEEQLKAFKGTLIVVSHDRQFLDNVVTSTLVFEGDGEVHHYKGGYSDWLNKGRTLAEKDIPKGVGKASNKAMAQQPLVEQTAQLTQQNPLESKQAAPPPKKKLSYKDQRELNHLPQQIEGLEGEVQQLQQQISDPAFYEKDSAMVQSVLATLSQKQAELDQKIERWMLLEA